MSAQKSPEFDSQDDSSEGGYADDYAVPRQSPIVAWNLYCTGVLPALKRHALRLEEQGVIVLPNGERSRPFQQHVTHCIRHFISADVALYEPHPYTSRPRRARVED